MRKMSEVQGVVENIKEMQRNWIGRSEGAKLPLVADTYESFTVPTTRPIQFWGNILCACSGIHQYSNYNSRKSRTSKKYLDSAKTKTDLDRTELNKDKTGVFTGAYAINPVNNKKVPIWIADYVLMSYGTGAVMAVPAHDQRDYEFAKKYGLEMIQVLEGDISEEAFVGDAPHINSSFINGLNTREAIEKVIEYLEQEKIGERDINYKLRDWIFSRQRYWGEPFPIIHYEDGTIEVLPIEELPLELPKLEIEQFNW